MRRHGGRRRFGELGWDYRRKGWLANGLVLYRPKEFAKQPVARAEDSDDDEEESNMGKMPSSDESDA